MKPMIKLLATVYVSIALIYSGSTYSGTYSGLRGSDAQGCSLCKVVVAVGVATIVSLSAGLGTGFYVAKKRYEKDADHCDKHNGTSTSELSAADPAPFFNDPPTPLNPASSNSYQQEIIGKYNLLPFDEKEDDYSVTSKKGRYLWARATFLDNYDQVKDRIRPALFVFDSGRTPGSAPSSSHCDSPLPPPFKTELRCNDGHLTGFCRIKYNQDGRKNTLTGILANTPDNISGCLLPLRDTLVAETKLPRNILVTDRQYYQISVTNKRQTYKFGGHPRQNIQFASKLSINGKSYSETLCSNEGGPGTELYISKEVAKGDGCVSLFDRPPSLDVASYYVPHITKTKTQSISSDAIRWDGIASEVASGTNREVQDNFCSPKKPFKEFILGSVEGTGDDSFCRYINALGNASYVAENSDGSVQSDYLKPDLKQSVKWQAVEDDMPEDAIIAGSSYVKSTIVGKTVPVYFCRFTRENAYLYGQHLKGTNSCDASLSVADAAPPVIKSTDFEVLVPAQ